MLAPSLIEPLLQQFSLLLERIDLPCLVFYRFYDFVGAWAWYVCLQHYREDLVSEPVSIVSDEHVILPGLSLLAWLCLLFLSFFLLEFDFVLHKDLGSVLLQVYTLFLQRRSFWQSRTNR